MRFHAHMSAVGLDWSEEEQKFARACQTAMGLPEKGIATKVLPVVGEITAGGSTDVGDISWVVATGSLRLAFVPAWGKSAHVAGYCLWRHVDGRQGGSRKRQDTRWRRMRPHVATEAPGGRRKQLQEAPWGTESASALAADKKPERMLPGVHAQNRGRRHGNPAKIVMLLLCGFDCERYALNCVPYPKATARAGAQSPSACERRNSWRPAHKRIRNSEHPSKHGDRGPASGIRRDGGP